jgi:[histone H3]-trimethyl-L-lysine4 demethylase
VSRSRCAQSTLISPELMRQSNIPVSTVLQTAGTFVVVLSSAFHYGFNHGENCAEAVNFALAEWLPTGHRAQPCTCNGQVRATGIS